jgi:hypothetical protein
MSANDSDVDIDLDVDYKHEKHGINRSRSREEVTRTSELDGVEEEEEEEAKVEDYELKSKRFNDEQKRENMRILLGNFSGDQLHRYECYRRSGFQRSTVKKVGGHNVLWLE